MDFNFEIYQQKKKELIGSVFSNWLNYQNNIVFLIQKVSRPYAALKFAGVEVFFNKIHTHFANSLLSMFFLKFQQMVRFAIFEP